MDDPYRKLADAIIIQAGRDYIKASKKLKKNPRHRASKKLVRECKEFFHSEWFRFLMDCDAESLIEEIMKVRI